ncbi:MAG: LysR family transcriptional regulator [Cellvibrio sp.]|uniref:LysR family transcriptional regulator n=1 Tax=Cellvibrio sp. TaxID=1965322 RepID=UPI0031B11D73
MRRFDHLADLEIFITVVETGSMTAGAVALGTTPSVVSRAVVRLEARLGCQLLRRTTRRIGLTDAGRLYLEQAKGAFGLIDDAERAIQQTGAETVGRIRLSVPTTYGHYRLPSRLARYMAQHPAVKVDVNITNRNVDLIAEGYDFAIRLGALKDSGLVARKLEEAPLGLFAAPDYLQRMGTPSSLEALKTHRCILFLIPSTGRAIPWQFQEVGVDIDWMPEAAIEVTDDPLGVVSLAESGIGICQAYDFIVADRIAHGTLVEVLPELRGRSRSFSLIYAPHKTLTAAAKAFIDTMVSDESLG